MSEFITEIFMPVKQYEYGVGIGVDEFGIKYKAQIKMRGDNTAHNSEFPKAYVNIYFIFDDSKYDDIYISTSGSEKKISVFRPYDQYEAFIDIIRNQTRVNAEFYRVDGKKCFKLRAQHVTAGVNA